MNAERIMQQAKALQPELQTWRRWLHGHPGTGFEIEDTVEYVMDRLGEMGYAPRRCGRAGVVALVGGKRPGKTFLLRADMDALPIPEQSGEAFAAENGKMHACGHDLHTAMLLGAAKLLKDREEELTGTVKLMFQPAEEIFRGALDMLEHGVLENPAVDAAMMLHVNTMPGAQEGFALIPPGGISMSSCEQYHITVRGRGGHGSMPNAAIDPLTAAAHIHIALQEINSRELDPNQFGVFTTGKFQPGSVSNVIPDSAEMWGTIRTADPTGQIAEQIKKRIAEIAQGVGTALRCTVEAEFFDACPCMVVDEALASCVTTYTAELLGAGAHPLRKRGGGSEDFAFVSHRVPVASMFLSAGDGGGYGLHHPKVTFDDAVLWKGSAIYAHNAMRWLADHRD